MMIVVQKFISQFQARVRIITFQEKKIVMGHLGEDGKLGLDDLQKVANAAKVAGENLIDKAKDLFSK